MDIVGEDVSLKQQRDGMSQITDESKQAVPRMQGIEQKLVQYISHGEDLK